MSRVKKEILIGSAIAVIGLVFGYVINDWRERAKPSIIVANVNFIAISKDEMAPVKIPMKLRELSQQSNWVKNLPSDYPYDDLDELVTTKLNERVEQAEILLLFLPKLDEFVTKNKDEKDFRNEYREFMRLESTPLSMTYFVLSLGFAIEKGEVKLAKIAEKYGLSSSVPFLDQGEKAGWKLSELKDSVDSDKANVIALALVVEWHPEDLAEAIRAVKDRLAPQVIVNQQLLKGLAELRSAQLNLSMGEFVEVDAFISNSGKTSFTLDRYAALALLGIDKTYFMVAQNEESLIVLAPGITELVSFRSRDSLEPAEAEQLRTLFELKIVECALTARVLTKSLLAPEWISSSPITFASANEETRGLFIQNARKP